MLLDNEYNGTAADIILEMEEFLFVLHHIINSSILLKTKFTQSGSLETMKLISFQ